MPNKPDQTVPQRLRASYYWDLDQQSRFRSLHAPLFERVEKAWEVVAKINSHAEQWLATEAGKSPSANLTEKNLSAGLVSGRFQVFLKTDAIFRPASIQGRERPSEPPTNVFVGHRASVFGCHIDVSGGDIFIGEGTFIKPGATVIGPSIIGSNNSILGTAMLRQNCIIGDGGAFGGELKNSVLMDEVRFPHPSYAGDSVCGYRTHFGNQATAANLGLFRGIAKPGQRSKISVELDGQRYETGLEKLGIIMGDNSQMGCTAVADPAVFLAPWTIVYPLCAVRRGFYGPEMVKDNDPSAKGVILKNQRGGAMCIDPFRAE